MFFKECEVRMCKLLLNLLFQPLRLSYSGTEQKDMCFNATIIIFIHQTTPGLFVVWV